MSTARKARPWDIRTGIVTAVAMLLLMIATGCATPESRIKKHPEMFSAFPPEVQERVRLGEIRVGDTSDMVYIALGHPGAFGPQSIIAANSSSHVSTRRSH
jgi:hypothetical protein